jgi:hypothetical protein
VRKEKNTFGAFFSHDKGNGTPHHSAAVWLVIDLDQGSTVSNTIGIWPN